MPRTSWLSSSRPNFLAKHSRLALSTGLFLMLVAAGVGISWLVPLASSQAQFADPAFQAAWERQDGPVAAGAVSRGWVWGPVPGRAISEPFAGISGNSHNVQYFDKGRMEINNPNGDKNDPFYVTNGLLAVELISGLQQTGVSTFQTRSPATINVASDADDPTAPTYQSFNGVSNIPGAPNERRATDQTGQAVRTAIDRQGRTQPWPDNHSDYGVKITRFEPTTGHNIPDIFWDYLNQQTLIIQGGKQVTGPIFFPWFGVTGYPISEPYWSYVKVAGQYVDVLIQAYERRVLTYNPHAPSGFKVQMGNIGQHYYEWRYLNAGGPPPGGSGPTPTAPNLPPPATITIQGIFYRTNITVPNDNYIVLVNSGQQPVVFTGYRLDSPKWDHVDTYYFPAGFTLAPGAAVRVRAGLGQNSTTDLYMGRTTVMWDNEPYDLAVVYDNYGRQVAYYFPAGGSAPPPPTQAVPPTATQPVPPAGTVIPTKTVPAGTPGTGTATPTRASTPPTPVGTTSPSLNTATPTATKQPAR